jgi:hypothetical protein
VPGGGLAALDFLEALAEETSMVGSKWRRLVGG